MSARSLLVLLLGEYVLPVDGELRARKAVEALGLLDVGDTAARQALRRLVVDEWLEPTERRAEWRVSDEARRALSEAKMRFGRASRAADPWDGQWVLVRTTVPEERRELRHRLRTALSFQGFGSLGGGWWIGAGAGSEGRARAVLERLGVEDADSFLASSGSIGADSEQLASKVWDLSEARARFEKLIAEFSVAAPADDRETFVVYTRLVDEWRRALAVDPQLPPELLPRDWPGGEAQTLLNDRYARWHETAAAWWSQG